MTAQPAPIALVPHEEADDVPNGLPKGFRVGRHGIEREQDAKDGGTEWVWLCSPLRVLALPRDKGGTGWGRLVEVKDPDGGAHRWAIPARLFAGDGAELRGGLLDFGMQMAPGTKARHALHDLLMMWRPRARAVTADRLGWTDEGCAAFVMGDGRVLGAADVVYQAEAAPTAAAEMTAAGTPKGWCEAVAAPCVGNPLLVLSVSLAFAGPLLEPLGLDGGGVHLRGASSRGKSTAQRTAVSVWGSPRFLHTWRATTNGLEGVACAANGSLLALDEMGEVSGREAGQAAYMLANGVGKARADRSGRARRSARWRVMILSSGELGLADKMAETGDRMAAGQAVRLLDLAADTRPHGAFDTLHGARDGAAFADRMKAATAEHHGIAGPAFVEAFLADREACLAAVRESIVAFRAAAVERFRLTGEGQTERAAQRLGLIAAAGEAATAYGFTGWPAGTARDAALEALGLWLDGRGGAGPAEAREAVARTRAFLVAHGSSRFEAVGAALPSDGIAFGSGRRVIDRAGWWDGSLFFIAADAWRTVHRGSDPKRAARHLLAAGHLVSGDGRNLATKLAASLVPERPRAYAIRSDILGADDG